MGETYYDVLEVAADATQDEIQAAYRERVLETHPDHNDAPDAAEQFKRVSTAKSVLTDGTERARYDRLGHDSYRRLAHQTAGSSDAKTDDSSDDTTKTANRSRTETTTATDSGSTTGTGPDETRQTTNRTSHTRTGTGRTHSRTDSDRDDRTTSHHARQRNQRHRKQARQQATDGWSFGSEDSSSTATSAGTTAGQSQAQNTASGFQYTVHDWEDEIELEWDGQPIDQATAVTIGCLWLLYPVFVTASVTSLFPLVVNAIVAACTLGFIGYLLTRPRLAAVLFGFWSLLFPISMSQTAAVTPFSVTGLIALGFVWVPFGYAIGLWWALRP